MDTDFKKMKRTKLKLRKIPRNWIKNVRDEKYERKLKRNRE